MKHASALLCTVLTAGIGATFARDIPVKPTGVYAQIDTQPTIAAMKTLLNGAPTERHAEEADVIAHSDRFAPPVLCVLGAVLAQEGKMDDAMFWFYAGQLRTRFDINRCADKSVGGAASILAQQYGTAVNSYAFKNPALLKTVVQRVVEWDAKTPHNYDQRWINLHGIGAFGGGNAALSVDEKSWPDIAKSTRKEFWAGFRLAVGDNPEDYFVDPKVVALTRAATSGDIRAIDALTQQGVNINSVGKDDATPLWFAYLSGNHAGFAHLLDLGADPTHWFKPMRNSVVEAVLNRQDDEYLRLMLDHKMDPNSQDHQGEPLLLAVAGFGSISKLQLLVERGANVNAANKSGTTAIIEAADMRQYDKVLYLLDHGADPAIQDRLGRDVGVGLFTMPNLTADADAKRRQVIAKLTESGYKFDDAAIERASMILNLKEATGEEPPKWLKGTKGINPAWAEKHSAER